VLDLTAVAVVDLGGDLPMPVPVQASGLDPARAGPGTSPAPAPPDSSPPPPSACGATFSGGHGPGERPGVLDGWRVGHTVAAMVRTLLTRGSAGRP